MILTSVNDYAFKIIKRIVKCLSLYLIFIYTTFCMF
jgi:hypothetical protein